MYNKSFGSKTTRQDLLESFNTLSSSFVVVWNLGLLESGEISSYLPLTFRIAASMPVTG